MMATEWQLETGALAGPVGPETGWLSPSEWYARIAALYGSQWAVEYDHEYQPGHGHVIRPYVPGADGRPVYVPDFATPMRKIPSLADKRRDWVAGTITLDQWLAAVDAATLADLNGLPAPPWRLPWWKRATARVLAAVTGRHPV